MTEPVTGAAYLARSLAANPASCLQDAYLGHASVIVDVATDIDCRAPEPWLPEGV